MVGDTAVLFGDRDARQRVLRARLFQGVDACIQSAQIGSMAAHQRGQRLELSQEPVEGTLFVLGLQAGYGEGGQQQEKQREAGSLGFFGLSLLWSARRRNHMVVPP